MLTRCGDCEKQISTDALYCPNCGAITKIHQQIYETIQHKRRVYPRWVIYGSVASGIIAYLYMRQQENSLA